MPLAFTFTSFARLPFPRGGARNGDPNGACAEAPLSYAGTRGQVDHDGSGHVVSTRRGGAVVESRTPKHGRHAENVRKYERPRSLLYAPGNEVSFTSVHRTEMAENSLMKSRQKNHFLPPSPFIHALKRINEKHQIIEKRSGLLKRFEFSFFRPVGISFFLFMRKEKEK